MLRNLLYILVAFSLSQPALALLRLPEDFHMPPDVSRKVDFWEKIFFKYPASSVLIHDIEHAEVIIDIIDFVALARQKKVKEINWGAKDKITQTYVERYSLALERFKKYQRTALKFGPIEERIWNVYSRTPQTLAELYDGKVRIRAQAGLADQFIRAANRAQFYLPYMEKIFQNYGVPPVITRLPFVESMFDLSARSKQGAVGIWQFMQLTAKKYLRVTHLIDERRSPFKATRAAAKYLKNSFEQLGSWPITVTSYNYGVNGMMKAINTLNTRNLDFIISNYKAPAFQYASKNFYAEFVAAVLVYNRLAERGLISSPDKNTEIKSFILNRQLSLGELIKASGIKEDVFKRYNPCLKEIAFTHFRHEKLPIPYEIFLPSQLANFAEKQINRRYALATGRDHRP